MQKKKFNPCTKQIKYQQIQEDVGGVSVLRRLKKKKILRVHKGEGKGLKIQLILLVDLTSF